MTTTHVPESASAHEVDDARRREAATARDLAAHGQLLRLWRPLRPDGQWCALGLFAAQDGSELEASLAQLVAALPPRFRRSDDVTPLGSHPNDPAGCGLVGRPGKGPEFLVTMTLTVPPGTPASAVAEACAREAAHARELAVRGHLWRLWTLPLGPDGPSTLGLWRARDPGELMAILESLPLSGWMTIETSPLGPHPGDPIRMG